MCVYADIIKDMFHNINTWPRTEGDYYATGNPIGSVDPASKHFYESLTPERLEELSDLEGAKFPAWGTKHGKEVFGGFYDGKWICPSIRFERDLRSFATGGTNGGPKAVRTGVVNKVKGLILHKPQLVVIPKDPSVYDFFANMKDATGKFIYKSEGGGRRKSNGQPSYHFNANMWNHKKFQTATILPIDLVIRSITKREQTEDISKFLIQNPTGALDDNLRLLGELGEDGASMFLGDKRLMEKLTSKNGQSHLAALEDLGRRTLALWGQ